MNFEFATYKPIRRIWSTNIIWSTNSNIVGDIAIISGYGSIRQNRISTCERRAVLLPVSKSEQAVRIGSLIIVA